MEYTCRGGDGAGLSDLSVGIKDFGEPAPTVDCGFESQEQLVLFNGYKLVDNKLDILPIKGVPTSLDDEDTKLQFVANLVQL